MTNLTQRVSLNTLWKSAQIPTDVFAPQDYLELPDPAQRYLRHAIAPQTPLATAVRLRMRGEIKLKRWHPFKAEQVIHRDRGMIWQAIAWMNGLPIWGWDRLVDGEGAMQWKLCGIFPVMTARGADITRSTIGRMQAEYIWLPSAFCDRQITWAAIDDSHVQAQLTWLDETTNLILTINPAGGLQNLCFKRWGNPEGQACHYVNFGGFVTAEETFSGYTIPTDLRVGWYFASDSSGERLNHRFRSEGEFFRATIYSAQYC